jgi:flavorubredoxin
MSNTEFKAVKITDRVYWVGAIDWNLRDFHGYTTSRGSTYNAYLILGDEPILVDLVKAPFFDEMLTRIKSIIDPQKIKYIISNHAEMDHSGALPEMLKLIRPTKIFASKTAVTTLEKHFHFGEVITPVVTGDKITLGNASFSFVETKMLHWPESMFTYFADEGILFSQDAFGMHLATHDLFSENNDKCMMREEAAKYFANILLPYSPLVLKLFTTLATLKLDIKMIAPVHGPIWHTGEDINWVLGLWQTWAQQKVYPKAIIIYDSMWHSTEKMALAIADGISASGKISVKVLSLSATNRSDVATELLEAGALIVGSPTLNQQIFPTVADVLCYLSGLKRKNLIGLAFGSYGWGSEATKILQEHLQKMAITPVDEPLAITFVPTEDDLAKCFAMGEKIAARLVAN